MYEASEQHEAIGGLSNSYHVSCEDKWGNGYTPSGVWSVSCNADWCHTELQDHSLLLSYYLDHNEKAEERSTTITIRNGNASPCEIRITQYGISTVTVSVPGTLVQELADNNLLYATSLKISGELNDKDISTIRDLKEIEILDLSKVIITDLPDNMFYENRHIKTVRLPETIKTIYSKTFAFSSLEYVYIPANVERIEDGEAQSSYPYYGWEYTGAFANTNLREVKFANDSKLTYIGKCAFAGAGAKRYNTDRDDYCYVDHKITLPASVETIGDDAFSSNHKGSSQDFSRLVDLTISFENNSKLKKLGSISAYVDYIDASNCTMIETVGMLNPNGAIRMSIGTKEPPTTYNSHWDTNTSTLYVPKGCVGAYYVAKGWKEFGTIKEIGQ